jgi:hypothetical protein
MTDHGSVEVRTVPGGIEIVRADETAWFSADLVEECTTEKWPYADAGEGLIRIKAVGRTVTYRLSQPDVRPIYIGPEAWLGTKIRDVRLGVQPQ